MCVTAFLALLDTLLYGVNGLILGTVFSLFFLGYRAWLAYEVWKTMQQLKINPKGLNAVAVEVVGHPPIMVASRHPV
jgi:hypothetical protein